MFVMLIPSRELIVGQNIIEVPANGRKAVRHEIKQVKLAACSKYGTHVNGGWCFDREAPVMVDLVHEADYPIQARRADERARFAAYPAILAMVDDLDRLSGLSTPGAMGDRKDDLVNMELAFAQQLRDRLLGVLV